MLKSHFRMSGMKRTIKPERPLQQGDRGREAEDGSSPSFHLRQESAERRQK